MVLLCLAGCVEDPSRKNQQLFQPGTDTFPVISGTQLRRGEGPYLTGLYLSLNVSPMQEKLRAIKPFPVGVVYYQQRDEGLEEIQRAFDTIRSLGFTALKQIQLVAPGNPPGFKETVYRTAIDAGLCPWYYGKGGWVRIDQTLVDRLGIELQVDAENMKEVQKHPKMIAYQEQVWRERVKRMKDKPPRPEGMGEPGRNNPWMPGRLIPHFAVWLEKEYITLDRLKEAWNCGFTGPCHFTSFLQAAEELKGTGFDRYGNGTGRLSKDFRRFRDAMKFQSELIADHYRETMELYTRWDPEEPERTGGHQIFENQAMNTWDLEGQAKTASIGGSFYASIHLTHHFFLVDNELMRPVYWQARTVSDMFKGGWAATWESTGGPTQWSGYQGNTVDGRTMSQLMVAYLAAGLKGIGLWMWNSRGEGWEVGEYALTDIQGNPSVRARVAGNFSRKIQEHRFELWEAMDEPMVGILYSWENEAMLGRLSLGSYQLDTPVFKTDRDLKFRQYHTEARLGISRALMNHHIPFEYVTERDLEAGLADRYPVIYMPYILALDHTHFSILKDYVARGGRLVADFPVLMIDHYGRLNKQRDGSDFASLFGVQVSDNYHSFNRKMALEGNPLETQYGDLMVNDARVLHTFDNGLPAVVASGFGSGEAVLINFEASRMTFRPGNEAMEQLLAFYTLGESRPCFEVQEASTCVVMRRAAPGADHYFILNDGEEEEIMIHSGVLAYSAAVNVYDDAELAVSDNSIRVKVPAGSGIWIRAEKE
ncbi:MAG: beta-galactosidase trimerization domain-containing protein [Bacteroidales bacterium]